MHNQYLRVIIRSALSTAFGLFWIEYNLLMHALEAAVSQQAEFSVQDGGV